MISRQRSSLEPDQDKEDQASEAFVRRLHGPWGDAEQASLEAYLAQDPAYADAYRRIEASWQSVERHATSPEFMALREHAISRTRRQSAQRWLRNGTRNPRHLRIAAALAGTAIVLGLAIQLSPYGYRPGEYRTRIGEQRAVELADHSRVVLDAATRLRVHYSEDARVIQLMEGQAQFSVAKDPTRPFKVQAGEHTVVAVGTVFTVEYVDREVHVAMLEGKVAVVPSQTSSAPGTFSSNAQKTVKKNELPNSLSTSEERKEPAKREGEAHTIELTAGEELRVRQDGRVTVMAKADLKAATAWREGKVIFHTEPLGEAVRRLNRYSRLQLEIEDPALASMHISGVFETGDTQAFAEAVQSYLPVTADYSDSRTVKLKMK